MKTRTFVKFSLIFAFVLILFLGTFLSFGAQVAEAVLPKNYQTAVQAKDKDWYLDNEYLNLSAIKLSLADWFDEENAFFDFTDLKENPVVIAVIDSGVNYNHELFLGKYDEYGNSLSTSGVGAYDVFLRDESGNLISKNTYDTKKDVFDDAPDMHGTHVAGIISILIHELNLEEYIKILPIKASYPEGKGSSFPLTALKNAITFALDNGADVVNMSLSTSSSSYGDSLVTKEYADKAVFVAAAGNNGKSSDGMFGTKYYPAASQNVIGVMNYTHVEDLNGNLSKSLYSGSNYGTAYDLVAPGTDIFSADGTGATNYKGLTGTSMSSPIVAFGTALMTLKYRAMCKADNTTFTPQDVANAIKDSASGTISKGDKNFKVFDLADVADLTNLNATKIVVSSGDTNQTIGKTSAIELSFAVFPDELQNMGVVEWFKLNSNGTKTKIGEGFDFTFTPDNVVAKTTLLAQWAYGEYSGVDSIVIDVGYEKLNLNNITFDKQVEESVNVGENAYANDAKLTYEIKGADNLKPSTYISWYVNGILQGHGKNFSFEPTEVGYYRVVAKIDGKEIEVDTFDVKSLDDVLKGNAQQIGMIASIVVVAVVAMIVAVVCIVIVARRNKQKKNAE